MIAGTMIACLSCKKIVWAYDVMPDGDLRGFLNMLRLPCRLCGDITGNYDQWRVGKETVIELSATDIWDAMHKVAEEEELEWVGSPYNAWFMEVNQVDESIIIISLESK